MNRFVTWTFLAASAAVVSACSQPPAVIEEPTVGNAEPLEIENTSPLETEEDSAIDSSDFVFPADNNPEAYLGTEISAEEALDKLHSGEIAAVTPGEGDTVSVRLVEGQFLDEFNSLLGYYSASTAEDIVESNQKASELIQGNDSWCIAMNAFGAMELHYPGRVQELREIGTGQIVGQSGFSENCLRM